MRESMTRDDDRVERSLSISEDDDNLETSKKR